MTTLYYQLSKARRTSTHRHIYRPYLAVRLTNAASGKSWNCQALIDTGSDRCIFHSWVADKLNHVLEKGQLTSITGIYEQETDAWTHANILHFRDDYGTEVDYQTGIVFSSHISKEFGILGTRGFLDHFRLNLDHKNHTIVLTELRPKKGGDSKIIIQKTGPKPKRTTKKRKKTGASKTIKKKR